MLQFARYFGLVTLFCSICRAGVLSVPAVTAFADSGSVTVTIMGSGGDPVDATSLLLLLGTGGPTLGGADQPGAPIITAGDIAVPGAFAENNMGNQFFQDLGFGTERWIGGNYLVASQGPVSLNGPIATFTISTIGASPGVYALILHPEDTSLGIAGKPIVPTLVNGSITILAASQPPGSGGGEVVDGGEAGEDTGTGEPDDSDDADGIVDEGAPPTPARFETLARDSQAEEPAVVGTTGCGYGTSQAAAAALFGLACMRLVRPRRP